MEEMQQFDDWLTVNVTSFSADGQIITLNGPYWVPRLQFSHLPATVSGGFVSGKPTLPPSGEKSTLQGHFFN